MIEQGNGGATGVSEDARLDDAYYAEVDDTFRSTVAAMDADVTAFLNAAQAIATGEAGAIFGKRIQSLLKEMHGAYTVILQKQMTTLDDDVRGCCKDYQDEMAELDHVKLP